MFLSFVSVYSQNEMDAIRYSRGGVGGSSRFVALGGAMNAMGADMSVAAYNPAGLGVFRSGQLYMGAGLNFSNHKAKIYNQSSQITDAGFNFNNFGLSLVFKDKTKVDNRHVLAFTNTQIQNFNSSYRIAGYTNNSSIAKDMLNIANENKTVKNLNFAYEGLGFNSYLLDTADGKFFSFVDLNRSVKQTRDVVTSGRLNEINLSYAYSYQDIFYFGFSLGLPQVNFQSSTTHTELDDKDSMRVTVTSASNYSTTYTNDLPAIYQDKLGFNSLTYTEYFKTMGSGVNIKLGGLLRVNKHLRLGLYYHSPTFYNLTDTYYNQLNVSFDANKNSPEFSKYPGTANGEFEYQIITPPKVSLHSAFIFNKQGALGVEYEFIDYKRARLLSTNLSDFEDVNNFIANSYSIGNNIKIGGEYNFKPLIVRAGYVMQGGPFGTMFAGKFVRNTFSFGLGLKLNDKVFIDFNWLKTLSHENYYLFSTLDANARVSLNSTQLAATLGIRF